VPPFRVRSGWNKCDHSRPGERRFPRLGYPRSNMPAVGRVHPNRSELAQDGELGDAQPRCGSGARRNKLPLKSRAEVASSGGPPVGSVGPPRADASHAGVFPFCDCVHSWAWRNINREIEFCVELSCNHCGVDLDMPVEMEKCTLPVTGAASLRVTDRRFR
jgi:hypothetical protein